MGYVWDKKKNDYRYNFDCGRLKRYGKTYCFSHYIQAHVLEKIVLDDIRDMARMIVLDEKSIREEFVRRNAELRDQSMKSIKKQLQAKRRRMDELSRLMQTAYEDRVNGKMPENICLNFIQKYSEEQKTLATEIAELEENWNGYGAKAFSQKLIEKCKGIIYDLEVQPNIFPTGRQSVQFQYELEDRSYLEFEIFEENVSCLEVPQRIYSNARTFEFPISEAQRIKEIVKGFYG